MTRIFLSFGICLLAMSLSVQPTTAATAMQTAVVEANQQPDENADLPETDSVQFVSKSVVDTGNGSNNSEDSDQTVAIVDVVDGDTIDVQIDSVVERVRLIGVDTPETLDQRKPVQCFGKEASAYTHALLEGQKVHLESDSLAGNRDKYHRLLRYVYLGNMFINESLIQEGYAHEYTYQTAYKYQIEFKNAELEAQRAGRGFWSPATCGGNTIKAA